MPLVGSTDTVTVTSTADLLCVPMRCRSAVVFFGLGNGVYKLPGQATPVVDAHAIRRVPVLDVTDRGTVLSGVGARRPSCVGAGVCAVPLSDALVTSISWYVS